MTTTKPTPARQKKTPKQRAEETLAGTQRRYDLITKQLAKARANLQALEAEAAAVVARLDYAKRDPALTTPDPSTTSSTPTPSTTRPAGDPA